MGNIFRINEEQKNEIKENYYGDKAIIKINNENVINLGYENELMKDKLIPEIYRLIYFYSEKYLKEVLVFEPSKIEIDKSVLLILEFLEDLEDLNKKYEFFQTTRRNDEISNFAFREYSELVTPYESDYFSTITELFNVSWQHSDLKKILKNRKIDILGILFTSNYDDLLDTNDIPIYEPFNFEDKFSKKNKERYSNALIAIEEKRFELLQKFNIFLGSVISKNFLITFYKILTTYENTRIKALELKDLIHPYTPKEDLLSRFKELINTNMHVLQGWNGIAELSDDSNNVLKDVFKYIGVGSIRVRQEVFIDFLLKKNYKKSYQCLINPKFLTSNSYELRLTKNQKDKYIFLYEILKSKALTQPLSKDFLKSNRKYELASKIIKAYENKKLKEYVQSDYYNLKYMDQKLRNELNEVYFKYIYPELIEKYINEMEKSATHFLKIEKNKKLEEKKKRGDTDKIKRKELKTKKTIQEKIKSKNIFSKSHPEFQNERIFIGPFSENDKFNNFKEKIKKKIDHTLYIEDILFYLDDTTFGNGKDGIAVTKDYIITSTFGNVNLIHVNEVEDTVLVKGFLSKGIKFILRDKQIEISLIQLEESQCNAFIQIINEMKNINKGD